MKRGVLLVVVIVALAVMPLALADQYMDMYNYVSSSSGKNIWYYDAYATNVPGGSVSPVIFGDLAPRNDPYFTYYGHASAASIPYFEFMSKLHDKTKVEYQAYLYTNAYTTFGVRGVGCAFSGDGPYWEVDAGVRDIWQIGDGKYAWQSAGWSSPLTVSVYSFTGGPTSNHCDEYDWMSGYFQTNYVSAHLTGSEPTYNPTTDDRGRLPPGVYKVNIRLQMDSRNLDYQNYIYGRFLYGSGLIVTNPIPAASISSYFDLQSSPAFCEYAGGDFKYLSGDNCCYSATSNVISGSYQCTSDGDGTYSWKDYCSVHPSADSCCGAGSATESDGFCAGGDISDAYLQCTGQIYCNAYDDNKDSCMASGCVWTPSYTYQCLTSCPTGTKIITPTGNVAADYLCPSGTVSCEVPTGGDCSGVSGSNYVSCTSKLVETCEQYSGCSLKTILGTGDRSCSTLNAAECPQLGCDWVCRQSAGGVCADYGDNQCQSSLSCDPDPVGTPRCHSTYNKCVVGSSGVEYSSGSSVRVGTDRATCQTTTLSTYATDESLHSPSSCSGTMDKACTGTYYCSRIATEGACDDVPGCSWVLSSPYCQPKESLWEGSCSIFQTSTGGSGSITPTAQVIYDVNGNLVTGQAAIATQPIDGGTTDPVTTTTTYTGCSSYAPAYCTQRYDSLTGNTYCVDRCAGLSSASCNANSACDYKGEYYCSGGSNDCSGLSDSQCVSAGYQCSLKPSWYNSCSDISNSYCDDYRVYGCDYSDTRSYWTTAWDCGYSGGTTATCYTDADGDGCYVGSSVGTECIYSSTYIGDGKVCGVNKGIDQCDTDPNTCGPCQPACDPVSCDLNDGLKSCSDSFTGDYYDYSCVGGVCQPSISSVSCAGGEVCVSSGSSASCQSCSVSDEFASSSVSGTCCPGTYDNGGLCCSDPQTIAGVTYVWYNAGGKCQQAAECGYTVGVDVSDVSKLPPYVVYGGGYACCPNVPLGSYTGNYLQAVSVY